jgi:hypothetical protein
MIILHGLHWPQWKRRRNEDVELASRRSAAAPKPDMMNHRPEIEVWC